MNPCRIRIRKRIMVFSLLAGAALAQNPAPPPSTVSRAVEGAVAGAIASFPVQGWVETSGGPVKVFRAPDRQAKVIGFLLKGQRFSLLVKGTSWYGIDFRGAMGWVEPQQITFSDAAGGHASQSVKAAQPAAAPVTGVAQQEPLPSADATNAPASGMKSNAIVGQAPTARADAIAQSAKQRKAPRTSPVSRPSLPLAILKRMPALNVLANNIEALEAQEDTAPARASDTTPRYIVVTGEYIPVLTEVDPGAPGLGLARRGERYRLRMEGTRWSFIEFGDTAGWVERRHTKPWAPSRYSRVIQNLPLYTLAVLGGLAALVLLILAGIFICGFFIVRKIRRALSSKSAEGKTCLIVAQKAKTIESAFDDRLTTLDKCFTDVGFTVHFAADLLAARAALRRYALDVICVDWEVAPDIQCAMHRLLGGSSAPSEALAIFYNVPDPHSAEKAAALPREHFLGISFSDRDLFKIVTPGATVQPKKKALQAGVESHALEGDIAEGHLSDIFQFIEMGRKNGCLLIDKGGQPQSMIGFEHGMIVYAASGSVKGTEAVFEALGLRTGHFRFLAEAAPPAKNMHVGTLEILMEWTRRKDEAARR